RRSSDHASRWNRKPVGRTSGRRGAEILDQQPEAVAGRATRSERELLVGEGRARDVEVRPGDAVDELTQEERAEDGAGVAASDVPQVRDPAFQVLPVLSYQRKLPEPFSAGVARGEQLVDQLLVVPKHAGVEAAQRDSRRPGERGEVDHDV